MKENITCGFIGLGSQGAPIARRIIVAGYPTVLWARSESTLIPFKNLPVTLAASVQELGERCDHVGICVVGDEGVASICRQLFPAMKAGGIIAIHSTILPQTCQLLAEQAAVHGIAIVDAPVSGGQPAADAGTLTVMLGGTPENTELVRPVLETFAGLIVHLGDVGAGQKAKLINNSLMVANMGLAHRAVTAGMESGLDRDALITLLQASSGDSFALGIYGKRAGPQGFERLAMLIEKVHLLGEMLGKEHESYKLFLASATQLLAADR